VPKLWEEPKAEFYNEILDELVAIHREEELVVQPLQQWVDQRMYTVLKRIRSQLLGE
jgi:hypothetical protein